MSKQAVVAGGGIGGLAAALAVSRAGWDVRVFERAPAFTDIGAGVQLGPNVVRVLHSWGLQAALDAVAARPETLEVRSALTGELLGNLPLGDAMLQRYGASYLTVHRADLHGLLLDAVRDTGTRLHAGQAVEAFSQNAQAVTVQADRCPEIEADALMGADGLWSTVRQQLLGDGLPRRTGQLAWRALVRQDSLAESQRSQSVTAWLGPDMHVVHYPVRGGDWLNVVVIVHGEVAQDAEAWDHSADRQGLVAALAGSCAALRDRIGAIDHWGLWALHDRAPMEGAHQHALGRVALLGDAAHPMRPYLAQGAGMAIEDAAELGHALAQALDPALDVPTMLQRYALNRWERNAKVQQRALRNGQVFHLDGPLRKARDLSMKLLGERLLDMPWLYGGGTQLRQGH
jgi:salicylate hydroxylase